MELEADKAPISLTLIKPASIDTPYRQHAKNYMAKEPKNPAPVYAPQTVAEAILYAAENPVRDIFVGGAGKALSVAGFVAPTLVDKFMEHRFFRAQQLDSPSGGAHAGLEEPSGSLLERGGYPGYVARTTVYTKVMTNRWGKAALLGASLYLAYGASRALLSSWRPFCGKTGSDRGPRAGSTRGVVDATGSLTRLESLKA